VTCRDGLGVGDSLGDSEIVGVLDTELVGVAELVWLKGLEQALRAIAHDVATTAATKEFLSPIPTSFTMTFSLTEEFPILRTQPDLSG